MLAKRITLTFEYLKEYWNMLTIDYYSDLLCVWAWIAQRRIDELNAQFCDKIEWRFHYIDVFGNTESKMMSQWSERGYYEGFAQHVADSTAAFDEVEINSQLWSQVQPKTSANAHLVLKAVDVTLGHITSMEFALALRKAFFVEAFDISDLSVLFDLLKKSDLNDKLIKQAINDGSAIAALMSDYQAAKSLSIKGSPSYVLDNGRQTLYGNVGYRVLHANIDELLKKPANEASWC